MIETYKIWDFNISPFLARLLLRFTDQCNDLLIRMETHCLVFVMCLGYSEDYENLTELVWEDDKDLEFYDNKTYPQFQLWFIKYYLN